MIFAVGNHHDGHVRVGQKGGEQFNVPDLAVNAANSTVFTDAKGLGENDGQTGDHICRARLQGRPKPTPATPMPAMIVVTLNRPDPSATSKNPTMMTNRTTRTISVSCTGGSIWLFVEPLLHHPAHRAGHDNADKRGCRSPRGPTFHMSFRGRSAWF